MSPTSPGADAATPTREQWARIKAVVAGAASLAPAARGAYLAGACGSDVPLRREVDSLLAAVLQAEHRFEVPAVAAGDVPPASLAVWLGAPATTPGSSPDDGPAVELWGTERFAVCRRIGEGGMGAVYEVEDRERRQRVAAKTLRRWDAGDLVRLKQEFRSLADIAHPNLVSLYELVVDTRQAFFTMALVDGRPFVEDVRSQPSAAAAHARLRHLLPQLVEGVLALHAHDTLHRDLKPSNVLVTLDGHVAILDFGLTATRQAAASERRLMGTPAYLAPERCRGEPPTQADDWYAVGVTLFEALTGALPFDGPVPDLFLLKTTRDAPRACEREPSVPHDLDAICAGLLDRDPQTRFTGHDVLTRLRGSAAVRFRRPRAAHEAAFVGREAQLQALDGALARVLGGAHTAVVVHGPAGMGKSALLARFLDAHRDDALLLQSRCHQHESVAYKALDGVVDGLQAWLRALPVRDAARLVPPNAAALVRSFPALAGVADLAPPVAASAEADEADPVTVRRQAFEALRTLLGRVARQRPVIVEIDDLHWADVESVAALTALFDTDEPPPLLLLLAFRSEETAAKPFLQALLDRVDGRGIRSMALGPLDPPEMERLVRAFVSSSSSPQGEDLAAIVRHSGGNTLLVEQLARDASHGVHTPHDITLADVLRRRLDTLPAEARPFLETLAVCGRPMSAARVAESCGLTGDERPLVARLRAAHLLRGSRSAGRVELYHDRFRESLAGEIEPAAVRGIHERLAAILVAHGDDDPEALFEHYRVCDRGVAAAFQAAAAAGKARAVLAFDRAATYYGHALDLHPSSEERPAWTIALAAALEYAGRPVAAAEAYLAAAPLAGASQWECRRKAAELFLVGGRIDQGLSVIAEVLDGVGVRLARGARQAIASLAINRLRLRWRGLALAPRTGPAAPDALQRIDASWSLTSGLAMVDPVRAADVNVRQLLWALEAGDPARTARALALEAGFAVIIPVFGGARRSAVLTQRAAALADDRSRHYVEALTAEWAGIAAFLRGGWPEATRLCRGAMATLRDRCTGVTWELNLARGFHLFSLLYRGELREAAGHVPGLLEQARDRDNVYLALELGTRMSLVWLAADAPDEAERAANDGLDRWVQQGFQRPHYHHLLTLVQTRLYRGEARAAWELVERHRSALGQSLFRRVQHSRVETANCCARCALALAATGHDAAGLRREAARQAGRIERERMSWAEPFALLIRATVAFQGGDIAAAIAGLEGAVAGFDAADMRLHAAAARRRLAAIMSGPAGVEVRQASDDWFAAQDVRNPTALARVLAPGFPD